jgi:hypothetical protein
MTDATALADALAAALLGIVIARVVLGILRRRP